MDSLHRLIEIIDDIANAKYSNDIMPLTVDDQPETIRRIAEAVGMMMVRIEAREYQLEMMVEKLTSLNRDAITDPLTKTFNRRFFQEVAEKEIERAKQYNTGISIILIDADYFKNINDRYGHLTGDQVLINLTDLYRKNIRKTDTLARFGGEEFVLLMTETQPESALNKAEQLRKMTAEKAMAVIDGKELKITVSLGVANWCPDIENWHPDNAATVNELLGCADKALYQSKESGRNRVSLWESN
ncbi:MAG: GGDEF domain-containing protein [Desulfobacteraceae bacterium]|nr:GGDEF domain-containing protein [Desulfobacteraceae bacterium]